MPPLVFTNPQLCRQHILEEKGLQWYCCLVYFNYGFFRYQSSSRKDNRRGISCDTGLAQVGTFYRRWLTLAEFCLWPGFGADTRIFRKILSFYLSHPDGLYLAGDPRRDQQRDFGLLLFGAGGGDVFWQGRNPVAERCPATGPAGKCYLLATGAAGGFGRHLDCLFVRGFAGALPIQHFGFHPNLRQLLAGGPELNPWKGYRAGLHSSHA